MIESSSVTTFHYQDEKFADIQMLRYRLEGFENLSLQQKCYIFHLAEAALSGRDIITDQHGRYNLLIRKVLECIYVNYSGDRTTKAFHELVVYLKCVWFANGIYHHYSSDKFKPGFTRQDFHDWLFDVEQQLIEATAMSPKEIEDRICDVIFNPDCFPKLVNQEEGADLVLTSAVNFYDGVSQKEAETYYQLKKTEGDDKISYGLNSHLEKRDGKIDEVIWKVDGCYDKALRRIIHHLKEAKRYAENTDQQEIIDLLIAYYESGNLAVFNDYSIKWLQESQGDVDFINGFIEVYSDPLGLKGSWEGLVEYVDHEATKRTQVTCNNAQWFEDNSPVASQFKKNKVVGVTARVINAAMLGGDEYPASAIGINLPNADWIREQYGSKSITIGNLTEAYYNAALGNGFYEEFVIDAVTLSAIKCYGNICDDLHTDLHECVGHGSGRILDGVDPDSLGVYGSTIEEARADLFGLYFIADPKLVELGLLPSLDAFKAQYYTYLMKGLLTQLVRLKQGTQIEEAHMRNRALIARWMLEQSRGAVELISRHNKTYLKINDYQSLRSYFGKLLAEIQRIKSEGDYDAAKNMVERYGVTVDAELHEELVSRYAKLNISPYNGFINPILKPINTPAGGVVDVEVDYGESYVDQMLRYSKEYGLL